MTPVLPLSTGRLRIEPLTVADAAGFAAYRGDPDVARYQSWSVPYPLREAERALAANPTGWPEAGAWAQLGIRESGRLRGDVAVRAVDDPVMPATIEIGVTLAREAQGRGIATEALRAVLDAAFTAGTHRVFAVCDGRNEPVARVLARLGLRREARLVDAEWWKGEWTTADTWAVLAAEWRR
jgi:RimJ/RimL family protein N-acetyltransferase